MSGGGWAAGGEEGWGGLEDLGQIAVGAVSEGVFG